MNRDKERNRKLSEAEKKRSDNFEKLKRELTEDGYEGKDLTVGLVYANIMAFVLALPIIIPLGVLFYFCNAEEFSVFGIMTEETTAIRLIVFLGVFFLLTAVHELLHGVTWAMFTDKGWKSISFGFIAKYMTPYCTCDEALKKGQYITGGLMPTIILGLIPAIISIITGTIIMFAIGAVMILAGGGDLTIVLKMIMFKAKCEEVLYIDHPYQAGLVAFVK